MSNYQLIYFFFILFFGRQQDKREYLIDKMHKKVDQLLKQSILKSEEREKEFMLEQTNVENSYTKRDDGNCDKNRWLKIHSKYPSLSKQLKSIIIQKISIYENQLRILSQISINEQQQKNQQQLDSKLKVQKIEELQDVKSISTREVVKRVHGLKQISYFNQGKKCEVNLFSQVQTISALQKETLNELNNRKNSNEANSENVNNQNDWNQLNEEIFCKEKKRTKNEYLGTIFEKLKLDNLSLQPLIKKENQLPEQQKRELLLQQYQEGEKLSQEEFAFLANTSDLLNSCLDKQFMQKAVNLVGESVMDKIERNLAEQIIFNHEQLILQLKKKRQEYFEKKNKISQISRELQKQKDNERQSKIEDKKHEIRMTKTLQNRIKKLVDENSFKQASFKNFFIKLFIYKLKQVIEKKKRRYNNYAHQFLTGYNNGGVQEKVNSFQKQEQFIKRISDTCQEYHSNQKKRRHQIHPPSVLPHFEDEGRTTENAQKVSKVLIEKRIKDYKLKLNNNQISKDKFQQFYTGGPLEDTEYQELLPGSKLYKKDLPKIITLQKFFKRMRMFLVSKKISRVEFERKFVEYQKKLWDYVGKKSNYYQAMTINNTMSKLNFNSHSKQFQQYKQASVPAIAVREDYRYSLSSSLSFENNPNRSAINISNCSSPKSRFQTEASNQLSKENKFTIQEQNKQMSFSTSSDSIIEQITNQKQKFQFKPKSHTNLKEMKAKLLEKFIKDSTNISSLSKATSVTTQANSSINKELQGSGLLKSILMGSSNNTSNNIIQQMSKKKDSSEISSTPKKPLKQYGQQSHFYIKQSKLIASARNNIFQSIKNSGFLYTTEDVMIKDKYGNSSLYYAVQHQNEPFVAWLLSKGAYPNQICSLGNTPTHIAFQQGNTQIIQRLLQDGADINKLNLEGYSPLALCPQQVLVQLDLQKGIIFSSKHKQERNIVTFDNHQLLFRAENVNELPQHLQIDKFYPLNVEVHRTVALKLQKSG